MTASIMQQISIAAAAKLLQTCPTLATPWTIAHQDPLSMGFPSQENWSGLPFPSPGELPYPGIEPRSPVLKAKKTKTKPHLPSHD